MSIATGSQGLITVLGYGSLLSQRSALETVPSLTGFRPVRLPGYRRIFNKVGVVFFSGPLWRDDILPFARYLAFCLEAAASQGQDVLDNFMDSSFLADGETSIRQYLSTLEPPLQWQGSGDAYSYRAR